VLRIGCLTADVDEQADAGEQDDQIRTTVTDEGQDKPLFGSER